MRNEFFYSYFLTRFYAVIYIKRHLKNKDLQKHNMNIRYAIFACILGTVATSCIDNDNYPELYPTMGTVTNLTSYSINSDSYGTLIPKNPDIISMYDADSIGQRILVNINFPDSENKSSNEKSGKEVTIYELYKVLTKKADDLRLPEADANVDFGNDAIEITSATISEEHLNIEFNIYGKNETIPHRISLLLTEDSQIDDEGLLEVELRHNNNNDNGNTVYWGIASFTLSSIPECSDENFKGFKIIYNSKNNSGLLKVWKQSVNTKAAGSIKATKEIGYWHSSLACQLQ